MSLKTKYNWLRFYYILSLIFAYPICYTLTIWGGYNFLEFLLNPQFFLHHAAHELLIACGCVSLVLLIVWLVLKLRDEKRRVKYNL